ncbi:MAG: hypothetical protein E7420_01070 [Ruminococcaceae bacterium]|nr:hypothetical protein [Oscillospiraceae bacterium]
MKKFVILLLSILLLCSGCGTASLDRLSETDSVVINWGVDSKARVSGMTEDICENLMSLTLEEIKNTEPISALYTLEFYDESDKLLMDLSISHDGLLSFGGKTYTVTDGDLDTYWIEMIIRKSAGPPSAD